MTRHPELRGRTGIALDRLEGLEKELGYFNPNVARMPYRTFREQGFYTGSGAGECVFEWNKIESALAGR